MKRLLLLLMMVYATSSIAAELKPFIGAGGQFQFMMLYNTWSDGDPRDYSDIYPSFWSPILKSAVKLGNGKFMEPMSTLNR